MTKQIEILDSIMGSGKYYVYIVKVEGAVKYVGKGTKDRYKHAVSGTSSVSSLNRDFFEGKEITVHRAFFSKESHEAEDIEKRYISNLLYDGAELYNKTSPSTKYLGDDYLDVFEGDLSAKACDCYQVDIEEEELQNTKSQVLQEARDYKENV